MKILSIFTACVLFLTYTHTSARQTTTETFVGIGAGTIALNSDRSGNEEIYIMDGNGIRQLTHNTVIDYWPSWSPDGELIAFSSVRSGNRDIYVIELDGLNINRITHKAATDREPAWSPDGNKIAFESDRDKNPEIYTMNPDGTNQLRLTNNDAVDVYMNWSPDGRKLVFCSNRDGNFEIYCMDADGGNQKRLTSNSSNDWTPKWSPDGRKIAFVAERDGNREIYIMNPDGSYLLFGSDRPGGYSLFDLYICFYKDDGKWTHPFNAGPILNPLCDPTRMSVSPDGKYLFFSSRQNTVIPKGEDAESPKVELWGDSDVYWLSTAIFNALKGQYLNKISAADEIRNEYLNLGLRAAVALLKERYSNNQDDYHFELSEFLVFCGEIIAKNDFDQADKFYEALLSVFPEDARIMLGYSVACILNGRTTKGLEVMKDFWARFPDRKSDEMFMITYQLRNKSRKDEELEVLQFGTDEFPGSAKAFYFLAEACGHYEETERAIENCRKALELKPDFDEAAALLEKLGLKENR